MKLYRPYLESLRTQKFGANANPLYAGQGLKGHSGEDYGGNWGTPIRNVAGEAYVYAVKNRENPNPSQYRGVYTLVSDGNNWYEVSYGHCSLMSAEVGRTYYDGEILAFMGNTGDVYSGGQKVSVEARKNGSKAGTHLHIQVRAVSRVTKISSGKRYLTDGNGVLKKDGYYFEWKSPSNGYNSCVDIAQFYTTETAEEASKRRENLKKQIGLLAQIVALFKRQSTGGSDEDSEIVLDSEGMNDPKPKFAFLYSPRFWQLGAVGLSTGLTVYVQTGSWVLGLNAALAAWFIPSVAVGSYDRAQDKKVVAAQQG